MEVNFSINGIYIWTISCFVFVFFEIILLFTSYSYFEMSSYIVKRALDTYPCME